MAASDLTTVAYIYKKLYSDRQVGDLAMRDHPLFAMIEKEGGFKGTKYVYAIRYGNPQGVSGTFADAQSGAESSKGKQLEAARFRKYGVITMDGEAMAASEGDKGAFMDLVTQETDGVLEEMGDCFAFDLYRDGTGRRGQRVSAAANVLTLSNKDDARNFKEGMTIIADDATNGLTPRAGSAKIIAVDEDGGTIEVDAVANITGFANNDYLFRKGDPGTCMEGFELLVPLAAPVKGVDSFRGIDRGSDPRRLAGVRIDDTSVTPEENAGLTCVKMSQIAKKADCIFWNPIRFWEVARRLNAKVEYQDGGGTANYGFEYINIHTPAGTLKAYSDPDCPTNRGRVMNKKYMYLKHLRGLPHIVSDDGKPSLRQTSSDGIEARARGWVNAVITVPGSFGINSI